MLKSKHIQMLLAGVAFFLLACGSSSDGKKEALAPIVDRTPTVISKIISLDPTKENVIQLEGKGNDKVELRFANQALFLYGQEKFDINVTLSYEGDVLTGFSVDEDLVFSKPVYISFDATSLKDNERFLEYIHASDASKNYFLPFTIDGDNIVYEFSHFSAYVFHSNDVGDKINRASLVLQVLENTVDKKGGLKSIEQEINEVYSLISIIDLNDSSAASTLQGDANDVAIAYGTAFIDETSYAGTVLQGNCMHTDLTEYINELLFNGSAVSALGASENSISKSLTYLQNAADAYIATNPTQLCASVSGMQDYASCGIDIGKKLSDLGDGSGKDSLVLSHIEEQVLEDAEDAAVKPCGKTCVEKAISFGAGFFSATTLSELETVLDGAEECSTTLTIGTVEETSISLLWAAAEHNPASYKLYYAKESFGSSLDVANYSSLDGGGVQSLGNSNYKLKGLTKDTEYYFVVSSIDSNGEEIGLSSEKMERTKAGTNFSVTERRINNIHGEWSVADVVWSLGNTVLTEEPDSYVVYTSDASYGIPVVVDKSTAEAITSHPSVDVQEEIIQILKAYITTVFLYMEKEILILCLCLLSQEKKVCCFMKK